MEGGKMFLHIDELKKFAPNTIKMEEYSDSLRSDEPTIIFRDYDEPTEPPYLDKDTVILEFKDNPPPESDVAVAYGVKPNIPAINVIRAIKTALGPGNYALHISDGSYTGYTVRELREFITNFDNTNLRTYIPETFDCDDSAQVLQGHLNGFFLGSPVGTIWYGPRNPPNWGHAVNIFYSYTNNKIYLIEPQNDVFYEFNKKRWKAWMVII